MPRRERRLAYFPMAHGQSGELSALHRRWKFYRIQPFALSDLLVVVLAAGCIGASALVPPMGHFIADGLIRSALVAALYGGAVYSLKLSPEINRTIDRTLSRLGIRLGRRA